MNVLITGIHGFVGSSLVGYMKNEFTIYGLDILSVKKPDVVRTFGWEDIAKNEFPPIDVIIHLAGKAHDTKNIVQSDEYFSVNTELTKKIYEYALTHNVKKFIFFSSVKAAADIVPGNILTEDIVPAPLGPYGESKIAAERYIMSREHERIARGLNAYIIRPCMIHGPGNKGNLNLLYRVVSKRIPWPLGAFENRRSFTSIENLCYVIRRLIETPVESGIYNMGDDEALSTNELIEIICKALGHKTYIWRLPQGLMKECAKVSEWLHLPLNPERLRKLTENYVVSNAKIKRALGIEKMPIRADEGLLKTIKSFNKD